MLRGAVGDLAVLLWGQVVSELTVWDALVVSEALIADIDAREVWEPQAMALFDICVDDTNASSYLSHSPGTVHVLTSAEAE